MLRPAKKSDKKTCTLFIDMWLIKLKLIFNLLLQFGILRDEIQEIMKMKQFIQGGIHCKNDMCMYVSTTVYASPSLK